MRKFIILIAAFILTLVGCMKDTGNENLTHLESQANKLM